MSCKSPVFTLLMVSIALIACSVSLVACTKITQAKDADLPVQVVANAPSFLEDNVTRMSCMYLELPYHYDLYIPQDYHATTDTQYPVIFIASPDGNAVMGNLEDWIRAHRWLAVMLVKAQNGPLYINDENFLCAHDDVIQRVRVHENMKFATGFSGGARMSARFVTYRPGFRGLVLQAAGMCNECSEVEWFLANNPDLYTFAVFGNTDPNLEELNYLKKILPAERFNYEVFTGGHEEAPVETMNRAFMWLLSNTLEEPH